MGSSIKITLQQDKLEKITNTCINSVPRIQKQGTSLKPITLLEKDQY